ncbi:GxxExxY protein [Rubellicoccus peritrichatus]|uniref:GxxExxY protein n=1 Tax=Rubellicoccus peritrichatus TaxID=3080537 RepID=A0AAQ3QVN2_9BACT|nr:GxxExxY protein [Puniceicoccus sp. CR14]WOO40997.1 GxxExxY protein [Puniceicoccus sp. CR14]
MIHDVEHAEGLANAVIGASIEVHREVGAGLLETAYEECLSHELTLRGITHQRQVDVAINYKGHTIERAYRIDLLIGNSLIVELKAVDELLPVHTAQLLTYLRFQNKGLGLLLNFKAKTLKEGIKRVVL